MRPIAVLNTETDAYETTTTNLVRNLRGLGLPVRQFQITAAVDPIPAGQEVNYSAVILGRKASTVVASHVSYLNGDRRVPVLAWSKEANVLKNAAGCITGAPANSDDGPPAFNHADDPNGNRIYFSNVAAENRWYALATTGVNAVGTTFLPGVRGGGPLGVENSASCWYKQGTHYPVWYLANFASSLTLPAMIALRIALIDVRDPYPIYMRLDMDDTQSYGVTGGPASIQGLHDTCAWARAKGTMILTGSWPDGATGISAYPWLRAACIQHQDVLKMIMHDHNAATGDYWRSNVAPWDTIGVLAVGGGGKLGAEAGRVATMAALGIPTYACGYQGNMFVLNNEVTLLGLNALSRGGATSMRSVTIPRLGGYPYTESTTGGIVSNMQMSDSIAILLPVTTTIAAAWAELVAGSTDQYGWLMQVSNNIQYAIRGMRIFYGHASNYLNNGAAFDNPGLNLIRICDDLFDIANGRIAWLPPNTWGVRQMREPQRNEWY